MFEMTLTVSHTELRGLFIVLTMLSQGCSSGDSKSGSESTGGAQNASQGGAVSTGAGGATAAGGSSKGGSSVTGDTNTGGTHGGATTVGGTASTGGRSTAGASSAIGGTSAFTTSTSTSPAGTCAKLAFTENVKVMSANTDRFKWSDATCRPRSAAMERVGGGYVRQFTYEYDGNTRTASGTGANGYNGWGFPVSHDLPGSLAYDEDGTFQAVFVGDHHAFYEYRVIWPGAPDVEVILTWFFATGRDNPVVAITYNLTSASNDQYEADARTPYGDLAWDGDENWQRTVVSGVGWGDRYKFITTTAPLTMNSEWDYSKQNLVPYVFAWAVANDAEMGAVQTQTYEQHDAGGYWLYANWGKTSANQTRDSDQAGRMPVTWNWPYQINQYELCIDDVSCINDTTNSHRLAWGANYGAVGSPNYNAYGDDKTLSGYPYQSYSVFMVLGKYTDTPVFSQVSEIETVQATKLSATVGSIPTQGLAGTARTDTTTLAPAGYDHRYSMWLADAANDAVTFKVVLPTGSLGNPVLAIRNYNKTTEPQITQDGRTLTSGVDYFSSVDSVHKTAYVTFHNGWTGTQNYEVK
jgi:hypothetical protein